jgi:RHS repeat-associated protein
LFAIHFVSLPVLAQNVQYTNNTVDASLRSNARVDPSTLGMSLQIPLRAFPGRGDIDIPITVYYSSKVWRIKNAGTFGGGGTSTTVVAPVYAEHSAAGWTTSLDLPVVEWPENDELYFNDGKSLCVPCGNPGGVRVSHVLIHLPDGSTHDLRETDTPYSGNVRKVGTFYAVDGSRLRYISYDPNDAQAPTLPDESKANGTLYMPDGTRYVLGTTYSLIIDRNGNSLTFNAANHQWTDTLGRAFDPLPISSYTSQFPAPNDYYLRGVEGRQDRYIFVWKPLEQALTNPAQQVRYRSDYYETVGAPNNNNLPQPINSPPYLFESDFGDDAGYVVSPQQKFNQGVLYQIILPNESKYTFTYNIYGEIDKIVYPTGGYERFQYSQISPIGTASLPYNQANRGVLFRWTSTDAPGAEESRWDYSITRSGSSYVSSEITPDGTCTDRHLFYSAPTQRSHSGGTYYPFGYEDARNAMVKEERVYSDISRTTLLQRTLRRWDNSIRSVPPVGFGGITTTATRNPRVTKEVSILFKPDGSAIAKKTVSEYGGTAYEFDVGLEQISTIEYDFASASQATAQNGTVEDIALQGDKIRTTQLTYLTSNSNYRSRNILGRPVQTTILDAEDNLVSRTLVEYDQENIVPSGALPSNNPSWADPNNSYRGNVTRVNYFLDLNAADCQAAGACVGTTTRYDQYGNVKETTDAGGNTFKTEYSGSYAYAYSTQVNSPVPDPTGQHGSSTELISTTTYDFWSGLVTATTDANGQTTTLSYSNAEGQPDKLNRLCKVTKPDGGWSSFIYDDTLRSANIRTQTSLDSTRTTDSYQYFDGLGRPTRAFKKNTNATYSVIDTHYDKLSRVSQISNPYIVSTLEPNVLPCGDCTTTTYDKFGRTLTVTTPDGAVVSTFYDGAHTLVRDQAGEERISLTNALGHLTDVWEIRFVNPNDPALVSVSFPGRAEVQAGYHSHYSYSVFGNLTKVEQRVGVSGTLQTRTFTYDALKRLKQAFNPESGITNYVYDASGNIIQRTDSRNISTHYSYDALNRLVSRSYSNDPAQTPAVAYTYDSPSVLNSRGHLTSIANSISTTRFLEYDAAGRVTTSSQATVGASGATRSYTMNYGYDLAGNLVSEVYPSGRVISLSYDTAGRISQVSGSKAGESNNAQYASQIGYAPHGSVAGLRLGNNRWEYTLFNKRLQPTEIGLGTSQNVANLLKLVYGYGTQNNNGNVQSQTIHVPGLQALTQTYSYDELNRLSSATETGGGNNWSQTFAYDRFGNRALTSGYVAPGGTTPQSLADFNPGTNRLTNRGYDSAGNVTIEAGYAYSYDAENHLLGYVYTSTSGSTNGSYGYDGDGHRVKKTAGSVNSVYVYDIAGRMVAEYTDFTSQTADSTSYLTTDALGSTRVVTDANGAVAARYDYHPYGEAIYSFGGRDNVVENGIHTYGSDANSLARQKFTQKERDTETGLDYFGARYYSSAAGRFTSVDPGPQTPSDPQSFNRYIYVQNNPLKFVDPNGEKLILLGDDADEIVSILEKATGLDLERNKKTGEVKVVGNKRNSNGTSQSLADKVKEVIGLKDAKGNAITVQINVVRDVDSNGQEVFVDQFATRSVDANDIKAMNAKHPALAASQLAHVLEEYAQAATTFKDLESVSMRIQKDRSHDKALDFESKVLSDFTGVAEKRRQGGGTYIENNPYILFQYTSIQYNVLRKSEVRADGSRRITQSIQEITTQKGRP